MSRTLGLALLILPLFTAAQGCNDDLGVPLALPAPQTGDTLTVSGGDDAPLVVLRAPNEIRAVLDALPADGRRLLRTTGAFESADPALVEAQWSVVLRQPSVRGSRGPLARSAENPEQVTWGRIKMRYQHAG